MADLEGLLGRLLRERVEFVVVGGFAAVAHGASLLTFDLDVCVRLDPGNLARLYDALSDLHPRHRRPPGRPTWNDPRSEPQTWRNLYLETDWGQLDCLGSVAGVGDFDAVLPESREVPLATGSARVLELDALIRSKEALGAPKDREALVQLRALRERRRSGGHQETK